MCFVFIRFDFRFHSEAHRLEAEIQLRAGADSDDTIRFIALTKEQLALITDYGFHRISFGLVVNNWPTRVAGEKWRKASVMLRPRRCRSCFQDRCSQLISACLP